MTEPKWKVPNKQPPYRKEVKQIKVINSIKLLTNESIQKRKGRITTNSRKIWSVLFLPRRKMM